MWIEHMTFRCQLLLMIEVRLQSNALPTELNPLSQLAWLLLVVGIGADKMRLPGACASDDSDFQLPRRRSHPRPIGIQRS
jgi:hypothetical protein